MNLNYEPKKIYDVSKSQEMFKRALKVVPRRSTVTSAPPKGA